MYITEARVGDFGKLHRRKFSFSNGINLVYGPNESGKSTLHEFILAMLFGMERQRGRAARNDLYTRYQPWDVPTSYYGVMNFIHNDTEYQLRRSFHQNGRSCMLTMLPGGEELELAGDRIDGLIPGFTEASYRNTLSISQKEAAIGNELDGNIRNYIANQSSAKCGKLDVVAALARLNEQRKRLEARCREKRQRAAELSGQLKQYGSLMEEREKWLDRQYGQEKENDKLRKQLHSPRIETAKGGRLLHNVPLWLSAIVFLTGIIMTAYLAGSGSEIPIAYYSILAFSGICTAAFAIIRLKALIKRRNAETESKSAVEETLRRDLSSGEREAERIRWELEKYEGVEDRQKACTESLSDVLRQLGELEEESEGVKLAMSRIDEISTRIRESFGIKLNEGMSKIIAAITGNHIQKLRMESPLVISAAHDGVFRSAGRFSAGTEEQIMLSARLASAEMLYGEERLPMLMDECFAMYDDRRLKETLRFLASSGRQVFIFTCQKRERECLDEMGCGYRYFDL